MDRREFLRKGAHLTGVLTLATPALACGSDGGGGVTDPGNGGGGGTSQESVVEVADNFFRPQELTIQVGDTVRWEHSGINFHTITPDGHSEWNRQEFPDGSQPFEHTFDSEGSFPYFCEPHVNEGMVGTITVEAASG